MADGQRAGPAEQEREARESAADCPFGSSRISRLTLRFSDRGLEDGFAKHRGPKLIANMRKCAVCGTILAMSCLALDRPWDSSVERYDSPQDMHARELSRGLVLGLGLLTLSTFTVWSIPFMGKTHTCALEIAALCVISVGLMVYIFSSPWYSAWALGYTPGEFIKGSTDTHLVLFIVGVQTTSNMALPIRCFIGVYLNIVCILCYTFATFVCGGPEMQNAPIHLLFLLCIVALAAVGKHSLEYHERFLYVTLLNEKRLRFQSEFALSNMHPDLPRRLPSLSGESVPSTSDSARAFAMDTDAHACVRRLAQIGEKEQWLIQQDDLSMEPVHLLGEGGFGSVYAGLYQGAPVALKVPKEFLTRSHLVAMTNELRILRRVRHPNIVSLYGACLDEPRGTMVLVLERVTGVPLGQFVGAPRGEGRGAPGTGGLPSEEDRVQILVGLSSALCHLHSRKPLIVHGDLKPSNVFVVDDCSWTPVKAKLLDFGLARSLTKHANPLGGTPRWAAPEVFHGSSRPSTLADVYSFGRIMFITVTGLQPCGHSMDPHAVTGHQPHPDLEILSDSGLAGKSRSLIEKCSSRDVTIRPSMQEVHSEVLAWRDEVDRCLSAGADGQSNSGDVSLSALVASEPRTTTGQTDGLLSAETVKV